MHVEVVVLARNVDQLPSLLNRFVAGSERKTNVDE